MSFFASFLPRPGGRSGKTLKKPLPRRIFRDCGKWLIGMRHCNEGERQASLKQYASWHH